MPIENEISSPNNQSAIEKQTRPIPLIYFILVGLIHGIVFYWYIVHSDDALRAASMALPILLFPLPFYLTSTNNIYRILIGQAIWAGILLLSNINLHQYFHFLIKGGYPFPLPIFLSWFTGIFLLSPFLFLWIDKGIWFQEWKEYFIAVIAKTATMITSCFFIFTSYIVLGLGIMLLKVIGIDIVSWFSPKVIEFIAVTTAFTLFAIGVFFTLLKVTYFTRNYEIEPLRPFLSYFLNILLPIFSLFVLIFIVALPFGIERLWERGFNSIIVLISYLMMTSFVLGTWRSGLSSDGESYEPLYYLVSKFVKFVMVLLPILGLLLIYTIGIRIRQHGLTVDRALSMLANLSLFGWTFAWSIALIHDFIKHTNHWNINYARINRMAMLIIGVIFLLQTLPFTDIRRLVTIQQMDRIHAELKKNGGNYTLLENSGKFDFGYIENELGTYGQDAMEKYRVERDQYLKKSTQQHPSQ